ncbi:MAG: ABC transporter ATP-binding protein, partial [Tumebacillaceae bacterium]
QRIGIACALLGDPELIFLDEPTSALDPIGRREVRDLMAELRREGKTVFLNSHLLSEVETVCDHVAIIHKSELIVQGDWRKLSDVKTQVEVRATGLSDALWGRLSGLVVKAEELEYHSLDDTSRWLVQLPTEADIPRFVERLGEVGVRLYELTPRNPKLEDVFVYWVNRKEREQHGDDRQISF